MKSIRAFVPLIPMIIIFLSLSACKSSKSSKTHCDAYGELKQQHDAYHREPVKNDVAR